MDGPTRAKLRTKTGCLTCRKRRKKCDERYPLCEGCKFSGRQCQWPTSADLLDRRFATHNHSRHAGTSPKSDTGDSIRSPRVAHELKDRGGPKTNIPSSPGRVNLWESALTHHIITRDLEITIIRHFVRSYYSLLLLPNCHPRFYDGWLTEIQDLMVHHRSLYYSVLACASSHIHLIDDSSRMQELALTYYSNAIGALSKFLAKAAQLENHNGLLMSVMLLYLHGCMGGDTYTDIPGHVNAATRILTMRLFRQSLSIDRLFDRLAVESVLYQIFLVTTGLWSDAMGLDYDFDLGFWVQAEKLLDQSQFFPGRSTSLNSPVLGVPVSLFRLALCLRQQYQHLLPRDPVVFEEIRIEVEAWEAALLCNHLIKFSSEKKTPNIQEKYYRDACYLYALIASVLFEQLSIHGSDIGPDPLEWSDSWQVKKAIGILREHQYDVGWFRCFIGNWPVYTLGFFLSSPEDKELIRMDMQRRWDVQKFAQVNRFKGDLEKTWIAREQVCKQDMGHSSLAEGQLSIEVSS